MKTTILTLALFSFSMIASAFNGGEDENKIYNSIREVVKKNIHFVKVDEKQQPVERALVYYEVAEDGSLVVTSIESSNEVYKAYITKKLEGVKLNKNTMETAEGQFLIVFKEE